MYPSDVFCFVFLYFSPTILLPSLLTTCIGKMFPKMQYRFSQAQGIMSVSSLPTSCLELDNPETPVPIYASWYPTHLFLMHYFCRRNALFVWHLLCSDSISPSPQDVVETACLVKFLPSLSCIRLAGTPNSLNRYL